jgi:hypothetical protein
MTFRQFATGLALIVVLVASIPALPAGAWVRVSDRDLQHMVLPIGNQLPTTHNLWYNCASDSPTANEYGYPITLEDVRSVTVWQIGPLAYYRYEAKINNVWYRDGQSSTLYLCGRQVEVSWHVHIYVETYQGRVRYYVDMDLTGVRNR